MTVDNFPVYNIGMLIVGEIKSIYELNSRTGITNL